MRNILPRSTLFDIVNVPVCVCETDIDGPRQVVQTRIVDEYADQHGNRRESGCGKRSH
jgi:hypothetical protein